MKIRLNKYLAEAGVASRRHADDLIVNGKVKINGEIIKELGTKIDPDIDKVEVGESLIKPSHQLVYWALNKPKGIVSTAQDEIGRKKVTDFVPASPRVYPIGRLDAESEGLIILTNDGELTQKLTHPSFQHEKEYQVIAKSLKLKAKNSEEIKKLFLNGLQIDGHLMKVDSIEFQDSTSSFPFLTFRLVLHTGYNRQIRKMCAKIGLGVLKLERIRIGKLCLANLNIKPGEYKPITKEQII